MATKTRSRNARASFHAPSQRRLSFLPGQIAVRFRSEVLERPALRAAAGGLRGLRRESAQLPSDATQMISWLDQNAGLKQIQTPFVAERASPISTAASRGALRTAFRAALTAKDGKQAAAAACALLSVAASPHEDLRGYTIVHVDPKADVQKLARRMRDANVVEVARPVAARWMLEPSAAPAWRAHTTPQWALDCIGFREVAAPKRGKIRIAVLDTGIDLRHPDLKGVEIRYDHGAMRADDLEGHGTHVAGIISAVAARKEGVFGVAQCDLDVWKVFSDRKIDGGRYVDSDMYIRALGLALDGGCSVVNLSLGGFEVDEFEKRLVARLISRGVAVVAAMGNEYEEGNPIEYPAALPGVIAVGGIDQNHDRASFSNTGKHICIVAPAVSILSTVPLSRGSRKAKYERWDGTSFAAPQVAGAIGYLLSHGSIRNGSMRRGSLKKASPAQIRRMLETRARRLPGMRGKPFTRAFGHGLIDFPRLIGRTAKRTNGHA